MAPEQTGHKFLSPCTLQYLPRTYSIWVALLFLPTAKYIKKILQKTVGYCPVSSPASKVYSVVVSLLKWKIVHSPFCSWWQDSGFLGNFAVTNEPPLHCLQCKLSRSLVLFSDTSGEKLTKVRKEEGSLIRVLFTDRHLRLHWLNTIIFYGDHPFFTGEFLDDIF